MNILPRPAINSILLAIWLIAAGCTASTPNSPTAQPIANRTPTTTSTPTATFTVTPSPTSSATPLPATSTPTPTESTSPLPTITNLPVMGSATQWEIYHAERNPISLEYPSTLSVVEEAGVVQLGNGDVDLEEGTFYHAYTMIHFFPYNASYLQPGWAVQDPLESLKAMIEFYFLGPWEDETSYWIDPQAITVDGYSAAWAEVRRQTEADRRTGRPVDDAYIFMSILREDHLVRVQILSHDQSGVDLLPIYAEKLLHSIRFR